MFMALRIHCCILQLEYILLPEQCVGLGAENPPTKHRLELVWARTVELLAHHPINPN